MNRKCSFQDTSSVSSKSVVVSCSGPAWKGCRRCSRVLKRQFLTVVATAPGRRFVVTLPVRPTTCRRCVQCLCDSSQFLSADPDRDRRALPSKEFRIASPYRSSAVIRARYLRVSWGHLLDRVVLSVSCGLFTHCSEWRRVCYVASHFFSHCRRTGRPGLG